MAEIMFYLSVIKIINKLNPLLKKKKTFNPNTH